MKRFKIILICSLLAFLVSCSQLQAANSGQTLLRLAHNQNSEHPIHKSLTEFSTLVEEKTGGNVKVVIYPNGQLGTEREIIELTQTGAVDIAKVSAGALENFEGTYSLFNLPYLFDDKEHYYQSMESSVAEEIYGLTDEIGFIGLTYYDSGVRNVYTRQTPVMTPEDMRGLKIRVQPSGTAIRMIELMGGAPTPMDYGEVYTSLQQGVIDGTENNETALTSGKHGEVAKEYSYTEHSIVPDILIISSTKWGRLAPEEQDAVKEAAEESTQLHKKLWAQETESAIEEAKKMGVNFSYPEKEPFKEAVMPLHKQFENNPETGEFYRKIREEADGS
ncbi:DctP family TRAP transporter solute-binding subunit [Bacillus lacus]|uniref:DctP family TRAP transporter solute-binding subunit n=1 Tax=Metabacillus lacus TaxID=1983721 RepID=A0A7X2M0I6_9BACI|nr:TRAP transporter substrate-binding protein [Metabacillus lacus]MRX73192.1 DctP family TRAP transporter solute-binding subunit [Metabacillus lacus]